MFKCGIRALAVVVGLACLLVEAASRHLSGTITGPVSDKEYIENIFFRSTVLPSSSQSLVNTIATVIQSTFGLIKVNNISYYFEQAKLNISATDIKITHLDYDTSGKSGFIPLNTSKAIFVNPIANLTVTFNYTIDLEKEGGEHSITTGKGSFEAQNI